jgi:hypothetical protein
MDRPTLGGWLSMDPSVAINLVFGIGTVAVATAMAIIVGRRRGLEDIDQRTDAEIKRLVDAQSARLLLLEAENKRQAERMGEQDATIAHLSEKAMALAAKVEDLELALARERRVTASMRGEAAQA